MPTSAEQHRRYVDSHPTPCPALEAHTEVMESLLREMREEIRTIRQVQKDTIDMLAAWNNAKGFVSTMKSFGILILWIVGILAAFSALSETLRHWLIGK